MILARIENARVQLGSEQTLQHGGQSSRTSLGVARLDMFSGTNSIAVGYVVAEHDRHILDPRAHGNNAFQEAFGMTETAPGVSILDADQGKAGSIGRKTLSCNRRCDTSAAGTVLMSWRSLM